MQMVENDRLRNGNREALTALRKKARTTKSSVPSSFESVMKNHESHSLVKEICTTCGNNDSREKTWMMFPGSDIFVCTPFHAVHTIVEQGIIHSLHLISIFITHAYKTPFIMYNMYSITFI